jgi:release factor glutamine methyltransferase
MEKKITLLNSGSRYLTQKGLANPLRESEMFLSYIFNCPRAELYLDNIAVKEEYTQRFRNLLTARARGVPLQYLVGSTEFMGLEFKTRPGIFIPRPETEILVETVIKLLTGQLTNQPTNKLTNQPTILDVGVGCGNIAISLAENFRKMHVFACDISDSALQLTKENCRLNKTNVSLVKSNLFSAFKKAQKFSLIVSNPPYIKAQEIPGLSREIHYEPRLALDGGEDGLFYYQRIINEAPAYLQNRGLLALEIGDNQAEPVKEIFRQNGSFSIFKVVEDYNELERVIVARKK